MTARVLRLEYPSPSEVATSPSASRIRLALDGGRASVGFSGRVQNAELLRDALLTTVGVRDSDLRYKGKDRAAYLSYLMKKGKKATAAIWEAQKSFLDSQYADDTPRPRGLDPVLTVDSDEASLEVFSRDESAYARLVLSNQLFDGRTAMQGTTLAELSPSFVEQIERVRTYQPLDFEAGTKLVGTAKLREIELPNEWLRGFLQVQSAATLPSVLVELTPVDLYNVTYALRSRRAKVAPRALRFELVPGARPRLVLEPWETALESHGAVFKGSAPRIVRIFGRQRLLALARALPHCKGVRVRLLGPGLPSFWTLDLGLASLTVALTSWSESRWASAGSFDALTPKAEGTGQVERVMEALRGPTPLGVLAERAGITANEARGALQRACLRGLVLFDVDRQVYRPRALLAEAVDEAAIRYGSPREALAHRLLGEGADVLVTKVHVIVGEGQEIAGEVHDRVARRSFAPRFMLDREGQVREAWCNCPVFQRSAMREGPCEHMIALFVQHRRKLEEAERLRTTPEGRKLVRAETRTLVHRDPAGTQTSVRVSLDDRVVRMERQEALVGRPLGGSRWQRMGFDSDSEAREAYFGKLDGLAEKGFIDLDAMSA